MTERRNERAARGLVERVLGERLEHPDVDGRVDHGLVDRDAVMEVTRFTDEGMTEGTKAWRAIADETVDVLTCVWVITTQGHPRYEVSRPVVLRSLEFLESAGVAELDTSDVWRIHGQQGLLPDLVRVLHQHRVTSVKRFHSPRSGEVHWT